VERNGDTSESLAFGIGKRVGPQLLGLACVSDFGMPAARSLTGANFQPTETSSSLEHLRHFAT
jgi:hypothetical protein